MEKKKLLVQNERKAYAKFLLCIKGFFYRASTDQKAY
jgi:hypothetical protein